MPVPPEVWFRGPFLSVQNGPFVKQILFPDAERGLPNDCHPDGDFAKPHFAELLVATVDNHPLFRMTLRSHRITISDGAPTACSQT